MPRPFLHPRRRPPAATPVLVVGLVLIVAACTGTTEADRAGNTSSLGRPVAATTPTGGSTPTSAPPAVAAATPSPATPSPLVIAASGGIVQATPVGWRVTLSVPGGRALALGDRPAHGPTHPAVLDLVTAWLAAGGTPRAAAISGRSADGTPMDLAVEVADPAWNAVDDTLMVTVRGVGTDTGMILPAWLGPLALYLDDAADPLTVDLVNGSQVALHVESLLPDAGRWAVGPAPGAVATQPFGPTTGNGTRRTLTLPAAPDGAADAAAVVLAGDEGTRWILRLSRDGHGGSTATLDRDGAWSTVAVGLERAPIGAAVAVPASGPGVGGGSTYSLALADAP